MADIALFPSVLGVRAGVLDAQDRLSRAGHEVTVIDQYDGRSFDDYEEAGAFAESLGYAGLMAGAFAAVERLPDGFIAVGFSNGGGMAEHVALHRDVAGVALLAGVLPLDMLGDRPWPAGVPVQIHYTRDDPFRREDWLESLTGSVRASGASVELYDYAGAGHLFTDPSLPAEYDAAAAEQLWRRVLAFCAACDETRRSASDRLELGVRPLQHRAQYVTGGGEIAHGQVAP
ncbi:MAG TPA: dienelactone hydrolase family protein [Thermoleophilaceae bacterium]|jgi:dienelactone hydrolase